MVLNRGTDLADYLRSVSNFTIVKTIDEPYGHMGATLTDAVLQAGVKYKTVVAPRVEQLRMQYPDAVTTSEFAALLKSPGAEQLLNWKGKRKLDTLRELTNFLLAESVETEEDFRGWIILNGNVARLQQISGIKEKTSHYLGILLGLPNVAVDRYLFRFIAEAGIPTGDDYNVAQTIIREAAVALAIDESLLDHSIWRYMSERPKEAIAI